MTKEQMEDEMLLAKIIASAETCGIELRQGKWGVFPYEDEPKCRIDGPVCAVGAGCLYRGMKVKESESAETLFAEMHGVTYEFANGVSDGFEETDYEWNPPDEVKDAYDRGVSIGHAMLLWLEAK